MADAITTIASAIGSAASGLFKFLGVATALLHVKQSYKSKIPWYQKIPAMAAHLLHATSSSIAGILLLVAMTGAAITFMTPLLIVVSATAFIHNISMLYRDIAEFFHFKKESNRLAIELKMPEDVLKSQKKSFFDFTKVTPEMKAWIKKDFENKPENRELIDKLEEALPIYLEKRKEIEKIKENISELYKELSELQPNLLKRTFDRIKVTFGAEKPGYMNLDSSQLQNAIQSKTGFVISENNRLMIKSEFLKTDPEMLENQAQIFLLQAELRKNYEPYQAFTDAIHERNLLVLKFPIRITDAFLAATVCALSIASLTAPVTAGVAGALTAVALAVGLASCGVDVLMLLKTRNRKEENQKEGEYIYLDTLGITNEKPQQDYQKSPIFKLGGQYRQKDRVFQKAIAMKASQGLPVEMMPEQPQKQPRGWTGWIKAPFEELRNRYAPKTDRKAPERQQSYSSSERRPSSKMKND